MNADRNHPDGDRERDGTLGRRTFMQAAGTAAAGSAALSGSAGATNHGNKTSGHDSSAMLQDGDGSFAVGGRHVVGADGYDTIQAAWNAADGGDVVYVHCSYDAEAAGESFPIELDFRDKEVLLRGGHPSGSVIDASHTNEIVLDVVGKGVADYRNNPLVQQLKIVGGGVGMRVRAAPYAAFQDLVFWQTGSHGIQMIGHQENGINHGSFGTTFSNCMVWNCGGDGFRLSTRAQPHSTTFYGCHSLLNGGAGVRLRGSAVRWSGGTIQNNAGVAVDARSGNSQRVEGTYFEGNNTADERPIEVYVDDSTTGFALDGAYFQGGFFRDFANDRDVGRRAVVVAGASHADVRNCTFRNYDESFLYAIGASDVDVHLGSHCGLDDTTLVEHSGCTRIRSDGTALPADLSGGAHPGQFVGDAALHDGSGDAPWGLANWNGNEWVSVVDGSVIR